MPLTYLSPDALAKLANLNLVARLVVEGFISGLHRSPYKGFSVEFAQHREYIPGDDLKYLDWKVYARTEKYYIKQYEEETNLKAHILVDSSASMGYKSGTLSKYQYGCYLAASLAYLMIKQQDSVGLTVFDERIRENIPPKAGATHLKVILDSLENISPSNETHIGGTFRNLSEMIKRRGLIIVISDLLDNPPDVLTALKHFRHRKHEVIVFHLMDDEELTFPFTKMTVFRDLETGERLTVDPNSIRKEYLASINEFLKVYRKGCYESDIDYLNVNTSTPFDSCLASYLAKRQKVR